MKRVALDRQQNRFVCLGLGRGPITRKQLEMLFTNNSQLDCLL